jgi:hypothetical protein
MDLKFKGIRYMFIFNLNVVFTTDFLKMEPIRVRFIARDFLQEQDFTERICASVVRNNYEKKCAMLDQLTKPTVHIEPVSSP